MAKKPTQKPNETETFLFELTPLQRFLMLPAFRTYAGPFENATQGRLFRQTYDRLGIAVIGRASDLNRGQLASAQVESQTPARFVLDFHEAQMLKKVLDAHTRNGATEIVLGSLCDALDDVIAGKPAPTTKAPPFGDVAAKESWDPPREGSAESMGTSLIIGDAVPRRRPTHSEEVARALAEQKAARARIPRRSSLEMIEAILGELNRQLHPLLASSKARDLLDDELDRMLRISSGTIAIHRQLTAPDTDDDLSKVSTADLRKAAGKKR